MTRRERQERGIEVSSNLGRVAKEWKKYTDVIRSSDGTVSLACGRGSKNRSESPEGEVKLPLTLAELTSFLLFAFQVAIVSFELIVRWMELTITEFLAPPPPPTCSD